MGAHETIELNGHRIERWDDGCFIIDLTNAGKRGKNCRAWAVRSMAHNPDTQRDEAWRFHVALKSALLRGVSGSSIDDIAVASGMDVTPRERRGIDVSPEGWEAVSVHNERMAFTADWTDFTVRDLTDPNMSCAIPKHSDKRGPVKCRTWRARMRRGLLE